MTQKDKKTNAAKLIIAAAVILAVIALMKYIGLFQYISMQNIMNLKAWINGLGMIGPLVYILLFMSAALFFLPGLPVAILGGLAFGPLMGTVWASIGSTAGAALAFVVARYVARDMVEGWAQANPVFKKIDDGGRGPGMADADDHPPRARFPVQPPELRLWPHEDRLSHLCARLLDLHAPRCGRLHLHGGGHRERRGKYRQDFRIPRDWGRGLRPDLPHPRMDQKTLQAGGSGKGRSCGIDQPKSNDGCPGGYPPHPPAVTFLKPGPTPRRRWAAKDDPPPSFEQRHAPRQPYEGTARCGSFAYHRLSPAGYRAAPGHMQRMAE